MGEASFQCVLDGYDVSIWRSSTIFIVAPLLSELMPAALFGLWAGVTSWRYFSAVCEQLLRLRGSFCAGTVRRAPSVFVAAAHKPVQARWGQVKCVGVLLKSAALIIIDFCIWVGCAVSKNAKIRDKNKVLTSDQSSCYQATLSFPSLSLSLSLCLWLRLTHTLTRVESKVFRIDLPGWTIIQSGLSH